MCWIDKYLLKQEFKRKTWNLGGLTRFQLLKINLKNKTKQKTPQKTLSVGKEVKELELVYSDGYTAKRGSHYGKQYEVS